MIINAENADILQELYSGQPLNLLMYASLLKNLYCTIPESSQASKERHEFLRNCRHNHRWPDRNTG
jgi:hypothetical protein